MNNILAVILIVFFCLACAFLIVYGAVTARPETMALGYTPLISAGTGVVGFFFGKKNGETLAMKSLMRSTCQKASPD
jgi:hypothetical protein